MAIGTTRKLEREVLRRRYGSKTMSTLYKLLKKKQTYKPIRKSTLQRWLSRLKYFIVSGIKKLKNTFRGERYGS